MSMFHIKGGFSGLAASSRVRLARNLKGKPFRGLGAKEHDAIARQTLEALQAVPAIAQEFEKTAVIPSSPAAYALVERHLISPELAARGGFLIASHDGGVAIMIGEEDHLRLQVIGEGLCPRECLETTERIAHIIEDALPFAYHSRLGYLTACPTNLGTGLRASVMLHLPILTATGEMHRIIGYAGSRGCAVRGAYGEGSEAVGGFYQISNQITLGTSSEELTNRLIETAATVIEAEKKAREQMREHAEQVLRDRICRAVGVMQTAWLMQTEEAVDCISNVLIGVQMGMLSGIAPQTLYHLEQSIRPALLMGAQGERDQKRAQMLREAAKTIQIVF